MDTPGVSPPGRRSSSSFSPVGLHVLVVDDDPLCLMVLERMLRQCCYKVTTCNRVAQALALLRDNKDNYDIVMSDVYMPGEDGFKLLEIIGLELDLPVIMMSANGETSVVMKGITHGACDYLIKPVRMEELRNIWQHVLRRKGRDSPVEDYSGEWDESMRFGDYPDSGSKKRKELVESSEEDVVDDVSSLKKARVNWSVQLHQQFVNAVNQLGVEKAVPKRILEIMNVQGLTRENVASHLQKYRLYLKRLSGVVPEPCPVASFQASEGGRLGGSMRVVSAGKGSTVSSRVKGLNLGGGLGGSSGAGRRIDSGTQTALAQYKAHLQKQAANRAQVLGGLGLLHKKEQNASRDINTSGGLHRMSSLDLGFLLKAERDEDVDQWKGLDSLDDLAAYSFRDAVKLEDTATGTRQNISRTNTSGASSAGLSLKSVAEEQLETLYTCTLRTSDKERDRAKPGMLKIQESLPASIEDTSSSTNLPPARHTVTATSSETFAAADFEAVGELPVARLEFYPGTPLDVSDYLLEEDFHYQG